MQPEMTDEVDNVCRLLLLRSAGELRFPMFHFASFFAHAYDVCSKAVRAICEEEMVAMHNSMLKSIRTRNNKLEPNPAVMHLKAAAHPHMVRPLCGVQCTSAADGSSAARRSTSHAAVPTTK